MPRFRYSFMRPDGLIAAATAEASSEIDLAKRLQREHCYLLHTTSEYSWRNRLGGLQFKSSRSSMVLALYELGSLLKAGLQIERSLAVVAELLPNVGLRAALLRVRDAVRRGVQLADAMEREPSHFSALHINLVRAGEVSGALDEALLRLSDHLQKQDALRSQLQIALIYPAILVLVGLSGLILLATVVLPQLAPIFADAGQQMPWATRMILEGASLLHRFGWLMMIMIVLAVAATRQALLKTSNRIRWDGLKLRTPLIGPVIMAVQTARFARTAGTLIKSDVPLPAALDLARQTLSNVAMSEALRTSAVEVRGGGSLTDALRRSGLFPGLSTQLISVGEETGRLEEMLVHQADLFERNSARRIDSLVAVLLPTLTIAIGVTVGGVLASILLAIMKLNDLAS